MFTRISRSGGRAYLQLVQAYRNEAGDPRSRVVANLGRLDQLTEKTLAPLIAGLERAAGRAPQVAENVPAVVFESSKAFGDLYVLHALWSELGLAAALSRALRSSRRQFDAAAMVRAMVFNRLCEPESKLGMLRWLDTVAMPEMPAAVTHDHLLRAMDALMDRVDDVESAVAAQLRPLLDNELSVVFYDLTTIRISGASDVSSDVRKFGLSKETGGVARQFVLGVIQTAQGLPIAHQVHAGNVGEVTTLIPMIEATLKRYALKRVVLVADRGLLSLDNLAAIEALRTPADKPIEYILAVPGRRYTEFADIVRAAEINDGVGESVWQSRRLVIAHDEDRAQRQHAERRKTVERLGDEGERMAKRLDDEDAGQPQRGRKSSDRRAYLRFSEQVKAQGLSRILKADLNADQFSFDIDEDAIQDAEQFDGKLLLVTNTTFNAADVVDRYKSLADIERGFRVLKSDIDIAPVHHRLPERIRAHALICFLALVMHRVTRQRLRDSKSPLSPTRALAMLKQIQKHRVAIDHKPVSGISRISPEQTDLFKALNLPPPPQANAL
ncbi:MAG: IS1634 family transposase [Xanthomonadales bacterium]|nr:IS1634 family transposase [Xanthomonadales bacterium]